MNDSSPYKSCFVSILFILVVVVVALMVSISMSGCSTKKSLSSEAAETAQAVTVASQDLAAVERQRLDRTFTIRLDDLELLLDADVPLDDVALIQGNDSTACSPAPLQKRDARRAPLHLKARQAVISSASTTDYKSEVAAHSQDSTSSQSSSQQQARQSGEVTAVAHPVPPWIYLSAILVAGLLLYVLRKKL